MLAFRRIARAWLRSRSRKEGVTGYPSCRSERHTWGVARAKDPLAPHPEPAPTRGDSAQIVEAIVAATLELGDPDASVNAIAERAGVGIASLYRYFPSKSAIHAEISRRLQRDFLKQTREILAQPITLEQAVEACCRAAVVVPHVSRAMRRALNTSVPQSWSAETATVAFSTAISEIARWVASQIPDPPPDLAHRVFAAFAAGRGIVMVAMQMPDSAPSDEVLIAAMVRGSLAYLLG